MRWSGAAVGLIVAGLLVNMGIKHKDFFMSTEQLHAECARLTAHPEEKLLDVTAVAIEKIDASRAKTICQRSFGRDSSPRSAYGLGRALFADKQYDQSIKYFEVALKAGYRPDLQYNGLSSAWYGDGKSPENFKRTVDFGKKSVEEGFLSAAYMVGYVQGVIGSPVYDFDSAVEYLEKAVTVPLSAGVSYFRLIEMFSEDAFGRRDLDRVHRYALAWLSLDDPYALHMLGRLYATKGFKDADPVKSFKFFKNAAERKVEDSYVEVGRAYYFGLGVGESKAEALKWLRQAAAVNNPWASYVAGHMYYHGHGAEKNAAESEKYTNLAISLGSPDAKKFHTETLGPLLTALRNMPKGDPQRCLSGRRSSYDRTIFQIYSECETPLNVLVCKNYALSDFISIFTSKDATRCDVRTVRGQRFIDSIYLADDSDALGWQLISGSRIQWSACHYPLSPNRAGSNKIRCEW